MNFIKKIYMKLYRFILGKRTQTRATHWLVHLWTAGIFFMIIHTLAGVLFHLLNINLYPFPNVTSIFDFMIRVITYALGALMFKAIVYITS